MLHCVKKPLIAWTIEAGKSSHYVDRLILSSGNEEIMRVAGEYGCEVPFRRPAELAKDDSTGIEALLHALDQLPKLRLRRGFAANLAPQNRGRHRRMYPEDA